MSTGPLESVQHAPPPGSLGSGIVVLSSSLHLRFIDQNALEFLALLSSDVAAPPPTPSLPPCLLTVAREIAAAQSTIEAGGRSQLAQVCRLLGPPPRLVRVQGFSVPRLNGQDRAIMLLLSRSDERSEPSP